MNLAVWIVSKKYLQMIAELLLVYISQLDIEYNYDGDKLFNDLKTRQAILKSTLCCTGNQCNNLRSSLESCLWPFLKIINKNCFISLFMMTYATLN